MEVLRGGAAAERAGDRMSGKRIVTIGGGSGPFGLLSHLKDYPCSITAVVSMADSGGSSRRLMDEFGQLPVGDLRQALVALSRKGVLWRELYNFRFSRGQSRDEAGAEPVPTHSRGEQQGLSGHSVGNLILSALLQINGDNLLWALEDAQELLDTAGRVLPVTLSRATLCAELDSGATVCGESEIDTRGSRERGPLSPIRRVFLRDATPACDEAVRAIRRADVIVLGPGDLFTSVIPNLLVQGIPEAIRASQAEKIYICNLMTKRGETDGYKASDFVRAIEHYLGGRLDRVLAHDGSFPEHLLDVYAAEQQHPVETDVETLRRLVPEVTVESFLSVQGKHLVRHDAERLIQAIVGAAQGHEGRTPSRPTAAGTVEVVR